MKGKANKKGRSKGTFSDFLLLERYIMRSVAWRSLSPVERAVYVEFAYHYSGTNNGSIRVSTRMLADGLGIGKATVCRSIKVLAERGFIDCVKPGYFSLKVRHCAEYRLQAFRCDVTGALPGKLFMQWQPEIQNTVPSQVPNGSATDTDGQNATRNAPSRYPRWNRRSQIADNHGSTTGTHLESTIGGGRSTGIEERGATARATMAVGTGRYRQ
jgi:hypothetical protein